MVAQSIVKYSKVPSTGGNYYTQLHVAKQPGSAGAGDGGGVGGAGGAGAHLLSVRRKHVLSSPADGTAWQTVTFALPALPLQVENLQLEP